MKKIAVAAVVLLLAVSSVLLLARDQVGWRIELLATKVGGGFPEVTWEETFSWLLPGSPVHLGNLLSNPNPAISLTNVRFITEKDREAGQNLFSKHCVSCHGGSGEGANGPALNEPGNLKSDWETYRTIQRGIAGTAMPAHDLEGPGIWQIMTYLSSISVQSEHNDSPTLEVQKVPYELLANTRSASANWLSYSGNYSGWRYSELAQINRGNVESLSLRWLYQADTSYNLFETNPVVVDGIMFITEPPATVRAVDATSGKILWSYERSIKSNVVACCGIVNRGVAVLEDTIYFATIDGYLIALNAATGTERWVTQVADHQLGYTITAAPLAIEGSVITGVAGGESGVQGFLDSYDASTGERNWRFNTVPDVASPAAKTWMSDEDRAIGGNVTWMTGSYDPASDLLFWGTGHSIQQADNTGIGDELYGSSILAIRGDSGELVWYFQATPNDMHGFDATQVPLLVDAPEGSQNPKRLVVANRNGFYYVLDRLSGEFLNAKAFATQNWALALTADGKPIKNPDAEPTRDGVLVWPGSVGATNWWPPSFSPITRLTYVPVLEMPSNFFSQPVEYRRGSFYTPIVGRPVPNKPASLMIKALDVFSGEEVWRQTFDEQYGNVRLGGLLSTAGNLLFGSNDGTLVAMDAESGQLLWQVPIGADVNAAPVTYAVGEQQFVTIASGRALLTFGLPAKRNATGEPLHGSHTSDEDLN